MGLELMINGLLDQRYTKGAIPSILLVKKKKCTNYVSLAFLVNFKTRNVCVHPIS